MQKVVDIITIENSLFSAIKAENAELYGSLFGTIDPTDMDVTLLIFGVNVYVVLYLVNQ